jgi:uncharacterized SAM-binding protein YcdF (DUF218 family)
VGDIETLKHCCVVFGAAVRPGGIPSGTLTRRVEGAFAVGGAASYYFVSGGVGRHPPAEAHVMADLLRAHGVAQAQIIIDDQATDTVDTVLNFVRWIGRARSVERIAVCSSRYHMPRCRMLLGLCDVDAYIPEMPGDRPFVSSTRLAYFYLRELIAYLYDYAVLKNRLRSTERHKGGKAR